MATAFSTQRLLPRSEISPRLQNSVYLHALRCLNIQTTIIPDFIYKKRNYKGGLQSRRKSSDLSDRRTKID
jgi:hypothetical protein